MTNNPPSSQDVGATPLDLKALIEKLKGYAQHGEYCDIAVIKRCGQLRRDRTPYDDNPKCTCGLAALLASASPQQEQGCRVCGGSGFVATKQCIGDGYGEVDSCSACEPSPPKEPTR
jgi:hypothetical protein